MKRNVNSETPSCDRSSVASSRFRFLRREILEIDHLETVSDAPFNAKST